MYYQSYLIKCTLKLYLLLNNKRKYIIKWLVYNRGYTNLVLFQKKKG